MSYQTIWLDAFKQQCMYNGFNKDKADLFSTFALPVAQLECANFTSKAFLNTKNAISYGYFKGSKWQNGQKYKVADDVKYLGCYNSIEDNASEFADWINRGVRELDFANVKTLADFVTAMKASGYFTESLKTYFDGTKAYYNGNNLGSINPLKSVVATVTGTVNSILGTGGIVLISLIIASIFIVKKFLKR